MTPLSALPPLKQGDYPTIAGRIASVEVLRWGNNPRRGARYAELIVDDGTARVHVEVLPHVYRKRKFAAQLVVGADVELTGYAVPDFGDHGALIVNGATRPPTPEEIAQRRAATQPCSCWTGGTQ